MKEIEIQRHTALVIAHLTILQHESARSFKNTDAAQVKLVDVLGGVARAMGVNSHHVYAWELHAREDWPDVAPQSAPLFESLPEGKLPVDPDGVSG
jgi:hypothetical protein